MAGVWHRYLIDICKSIHLVVESNYNVENVWKFIPIERKILHEFHGEFCIFDMLLDVRKVMGSSPLVSTMKNHPKRVVFLVM